MLSRDSSNRLDCTDVQVIDLRSIENLLASQKELEDFKERYNTHREIFLARMQREVNDLVNCRILRKEVDSLNEKNEVLVNINNELKKELKIAKTGKKKEAQVPRHIQHQGRRPGVADKCPFD